MGTYRIMVAESRSYEVEYLVDAENASEAREKAEIGDTIEETGARITGVTDRTAITDPVEVEDSEA